MAATKITRMPDNLAAGSTFAHEYANEIKTVVNEHSDDIDLMNESISNVDNTSDLDKPVSTLQQAAIDALKEAVGLEPLADFPADGVIALDRPGGRGYNSKTINAALAISVASGSVEMGSAYGILVADGVNVPTLTGITLWDDTIFDNTAGVANHWAASVKNGVAYLSWHQLPA